MINRIARRVMAWLFAGGTSRMNPVRMVWWRVLDDARFAVRFICARIKYAASFGVLIRWVLHLAAGNPAYTLAVVLLVVSPLPFRPAVLVFVSTVGVFEAWFYRRWFRGEGSWVHGWRLWWRVRRSLPSEWNEAAAKTKDVQSSIGREYNLGGRVRPIADHPKTAWLPRIEWPVVSAWVGHPPGRTADAAVEFQRALAANILRVDDIEFDFKRTRDSVGRLNVTFVDVLELTVKPVRSNVTVEGQ